MPSVSVVRQPVYGIPGLLRTGRYRQTVLSTPGLTNYWPFSESASPYIDIFGGVALAVQGALISKTPGLVGSQPWDRCISSSGGGSVRSAGAWSFPATFTFEGWYQAVSAGAGEWAIVGSGYSPGAMMFVRGGSFSLYCQGTNLLSSYTFPLNVPTYCVGTRDGTNLRVYANGALMAGPTAASAPGASGFLLECGNYSNSAGINLNGMIDEVALYNRALTGAEVLAHFRAAAG